MAMNFLAARLLRLRRLAACPRPMAEEGVPPATPAGEVDALVKPDESAPIKELVKVMDTAKASGIKNIKLRTKPLEAPSAP